MPSVDNRLVVVREGVAIDVTRGRGATEEGLEACGPAVTDPMLIRPTGCTSRHVDLWFTQRQRGISGFLSTNLYET